MTEDHRVLFRERDHYGIILDVSFRGFDKGAATFGSVFMDEDEPDKLYLFYSGAPDTEWTHATIGVAISNDGFNYTKLKDNPILEKVPNCFCHKEALTPAVTKIDNTYYMFLSGRASPNSPRGIGLAYADDPKGPWCIIGELIKPSPFSWEAPDIDNGPSVLKTRRDTCLVFYSNVLVSYRLGIFGIVLRRPRVRKVGILKVRIGGTSLSEIEVDRFPNNPLNHLNGLWGSWNESLFCPGYIKLGNTHHLFPATSIYSISPPKQYIGLATSKSVSFSKETTHIGKLIDGMSEKTQIMPNAKGEIFLDTPSPLLIEDEKKLFLYYAVEDTADGIWRTALTTFKLRADD